MSFSESKSSLALRDNFADQAGIAVAEKVTEPAIQLDNLGKCYQIYSKPHERLLQMLFRGKRQYYREFWALRNVSLEVGRGDVVGIIGRNGAGKSTMLQLVCGTLNPTSGDIVVQGRVAALLELGSGFNPEFTGRENAFLSATVSGLTRKEVDDRLEDIIEFSGIRDFIDQPVKTYSSGMYVRLAFAVATSVDPDILVVDEALSVGDGDFCRKSFDRIMAMKEAGKTILFCSHSLYQIEAICNKAIWLVDGKVQMIGEPAPVVMAYSDSLNLSTSRTSTDLAAAPAYDDVTGSSPLEVDKLHKGTARIVAVRVKVNSVEGQKLQVESGQNDVEVRIKFAANQSLPMPNVGLCFVCQDGRVVASAGTQLDRYLPQRHADGGGEVTITFPRFSLLRGEYQLDVYLLCERGIHVYDSVIMAAMLLVNQANLELGLVTLPHSWSG
jgi:lipopolysaccharide transport system ATP-binding protein